MRPIILIAHNLRSTHNVGSLLRTSEGLGIELVWLTGYTPYPRQKKEERLPHIADKLNDQIHKTALGAEESIKWSRSDDIFEVITELRGNGYQMVALEQSAVATPLPEFKPTDKVAIVVGREVEGLEEEVLKRMEQVVQIPMFGRKESFNVVQAAAMALYHCRFLPYP